LAMIYPDKASANIKMSHEANIPSKECPRLLQML
jgi:hypothetical protein